MLWLAVVLGAACGESTPVQVLDQTSQLDVELTTDLDVPKDVDSISVTVAGTSGPTLFELGPAGLAVPATIASLGILFPAERIGTPADQIRDVTVIAWKGAAPFTVSRAVAAIPYEPGVRTMRISLSWLCAGTAREVAPGQLESTCPAGQSCRAGVCRGNDRTAEVLAMPGPLTRPACFDFGKCMASGSPVAVDLATCTAAKGDATNYAVVKPSGTEGICTATSCLAPLSSDSVEGWRDAGAAVALPPAVCSALADGRATAVIGSNACPTWSPDQRFCGPLP